MKKTIENVTNYITIEARRFPVVVKPTHGGEGDTYYITLSKEQLQAAQIVGQSSKELISRLFERDGLGGYVLEIGKAEKKTIRVALDDLWEVKA